MTELLAAPALPKTLPASRWICPFCPLLCEHLGVDTVALPVNLAGADCPRAKQRLADLLGAPAPATPTLNGQPITLDAALWAAAGILQTSRQPLLGGLGTDVSGGRALYRLATVTGAISDSAQGPALTQGQRALQDRGGYSTTLAELRTRADLVVCVGAVFADIAPLFLDRCVLPPRTAGVVGEAPPRQVVVLGPAGTPSPAEAAALARLAADTRVALQVVPLQGDLHNTVALLAALVAGREPPAASFNLTPTQLQAALFNPPPTQLPAALLNPTPSWPLADPSIDPPHEPPDPSPITPPITPPAAPPMQALQALADQLRAASYSVIVGAPGLLPVHGGLVIEAVHHIVEQLNLKTRAAALWLGGGEGAATVNQVFTWLSGLPLRSRAGPAGLEHEPVCFDATRLLADGAVDALLWVSSFDATMLPPATRCPRIVFGPPALGAALHAAPASGGQTVFIPVATPGIHIAGDLFRTDGTVLLPLVPLPVPPPPRDNAGLPPLAVVVQRLLTMISPGTPA